MASCHISVNSMPYPLLHGLLCKRCLFYRQYSDDERRSEAVGFVRALPNQLVPVCRQCSQPPRTLNGDSLMISLEQGVDEWVVQKVMTS